MMKSSRLITNRSCKLFSVLAVSGLLLGAACTPTLQTHGHSLDKAAIATITPGVTNQDEVFRLLGSPSSVGTFETDRWYYVMQQTEQSSFYQAETIAQDVVVIDFDERSIVSNIKGLGLEQAVAVKPDSNTTPTLGNDLSIAQQLLGNIGRFGTSDGKGPPR